MSASLVQPFQVVILYDRAPSGVRAMQTYESLCRELGVEYSFDVKLWRLDMLSLVDQGQLAMPRLDNADMVIVACEAGYESLFLLDDWAIRWPRVSNDARRAMVALYTGPAEAKGTNSYERWLATLGSLAARVGLDLITQFADHVARTKLREVVVPAVVPPRPSRLDVSVIAPPARHTPVRLEMLALAVPAFGTPRWGINE